jgi:hypothetical protein
MPKDPNKIRKEVHLTPEEVKNVEDAAKIAGPRVSVKNYMETAIIENQRKT